MEADWTVGAPTHRYRYVFAQAAEGSVELAPFGCGHLVEQLYVIGDPEIIGPGHAMTDGEKAAVVTAAQYWTTFAKKGDPGPSWPTFDSGEGGATMIIGPDGAARAATAWRGPQHKFHALWQGYCGQMPFYRCSTVNGSEI